MQMDYVKQLVVTRVCTWRTIWRCLNVFAVAGLVVSGVCRADEVTLSASKGDAGTVVIRGTVLDLTGPSFVFVQRMVTSEPIPRIVFCVSKLTGVMNLMLAARR